MEGAPRFIIASLVLLVHVLAAPPLPAAGAFAADPAPAEQRDCCASGSDPDAGSPQGPGDCCPEGCTHCPLSCCGGIPALIEEPPAALARPVTSPAPPARARTRLPASDPTAIYHPPRV